MIWAEDQLEQVTTCGLCGAADPAFIVERPDGLPVVECRRCGFAFLGKRPGRTAMNAYYDQAYFQDSDTYQDYFGYARVVTELAYCPRLHRLAPFISDWKSKKVIEIGCAAGSTLALIERGGGTVEGIEISQTAAGIARDHFGLKIFNGPYEEAVLSPEEYDCVLMFDVLEHLAEPGKAIDRVADILKKGGFFALTVPNFDGYALEGLNWPGLRSWFEHVNYFTSDALRRRLASRGFFILEQHTYTAGADRHGKAESGTLRAFKTLMKQQLPESFVRFARGLKFRIKGPPRLDVRTDKSGLDLFVLAQKGPASPVAVKD